MARNLTTGERVGEDGRIHTGGGLGRYDIGGEILGINTGGAEHLGVTAAPLRIRDQDTDEHFISFIGPSGEVGCLDWEDGKLTFSGDMDESARIFLTCLEPLVRAAAQALMENKA